MSVATAPCRSIDCVRPLMCGGRRIDHGNVSAAPRPKNSAIAGHVIKNVRPEGELVADQRRLVASTLAVTSTRGCGDTASACGAATPSERPGSASARPERVAALRDGPARRRARAQAARGDARTDAQRTQIQRDQIQREVGGAVDGDPPVARVVRRDRAAPSRTGPTPCHAPSGRPAPARASATAPDRWHHANAAPTSRAVHRRRAGRDRGLGGATVAAARRAAWARAARGAGRRGRVVGGRRWRRRWPSRRAVAGASARGARRAAARGRRRRFRRAAAGRRDARARRSARAPRPRDPAPAR